MANKPDPAEIAAAAWEFARRGQADRAAEQLVRLRGEFDEWRDSSGLSKEDFEDVFDDVILRILDRLSESFKNVPRESALAYFSLMLRSGARDLTQRRRNVSSLEDLPESEWTEWQSIASEEARYQRIEAISLLRNALESLRKDHPRSYEVIRPWFQGMDTAEIAHLINTTTGAARERLSHARRVLRGLLPPDFEFGELEFGSLLLKDEFAELFPGNAKSAYGSAVALGARFRERESGAPELVRHEGAVALLRGIPGNTLVTRDSVVAVPGHDGETRFPVWQFESGIRDHMPKILAALKFQDDDWGRYLFFTQSNPNLDGLTPLEALRANDVEAVINAAAAYGESEWNG